MTPEGLIPQSAFRVEALERREFLSADVASLWVGAGLSRGATAIEVVEIEPIDADDDVAIHPADLPPSVLAALDAAYPDAHILQAAVTLEEGSEEFEILARVDGRSMTVIFDARGQPIETAEWVSFEDLPRAVQKWIRSTFPGAGVPDVAYVTTDEGASYDLVIAPAGGTAMEAKVRFTFSASRPIDWQDDGALKTIGMTPVGNLAPDADDSGRLANGTVAGDATIAVSANTTAEPLPRDIAPVDEANSSRPASTAITAVDGVPFFTEVSVSKSQPLAVASSAIGSAAHLAVSGMWIHWIGTAGTINAELAARKLSAILDDILAATDRGLESATYGASAVKIAGAAVLLIGSQMFLSPRRTRTPPAMVVTPATSTWRWVIGGPPTRGRSLYRATRMRS